MTARDSDRPPERLIHGDYGSLLRQASREWESGLDEQAAFRRVSERLAARHRGLAGTRTRWLMTAAPLAVAVLAVIFVFSRRESAEVTPELVAENWRPAAAPSARSSVAVDMASSIPATPLPLRRAERKGEPRVAKPRVAAPAPASSPIPTPSPSVAAPSLPSSAPSAERSEPAPSPDCLSFARQGQSRAAEACFSERAQGTGLAAEMALYELSRLRRDVLSDANGALRALADYRTRFPGGSLRREVDMSQLELLLELGRSDDALRQSEELLSSSTSGERASELRMLRGHILRKQSRFADAAREYDLAGGAGARGNEAFYFRAICLDALGRASEAAAALTRYLEQPQRPYAEDAKRRLERLKP